MKKVIRLKQNQTYVIMDGNGILHEITTEQNREILTIEQIVNSEASNKGYFVNSDGPQTAALSYFGEHYVDTHTMKQAEKLTALAEIMRIADYYNEHYADGWEVDWKDVGQKKWLIKTMFSGLHVTDYSTNMFGLPTFATKELAQLALDNNREVFERFFNA